MKPIPLDTKPQHLDLSTQLKMVIRLMDLWQLSDVQRAAVLALGDNEQARQRAFAQLLAIHKMLRLLFPANRQLAYRWMTSQNKAFDGFTPIEMVQQQGVRGVQRAHDYLAQFAAGYVGEHQRSEIDSDVP